MEISLPIDDVLGDVSAMLVTETRLVLAAPPGAGKTTRIPLTLMREDWCEGQILLLEPRRIAARMAAERMARTLGEKIGETIGLRTRLDSRVGPKTKVEVVTEGIFTRRLLADPDLPGVSAVIFDEFHERSLEADLGLTLALEAQSAFREDMRLVVMSATLDTERVANFLNAPAVESEGRAFAVETKYLGRSHEPVHVQMSKAVQRALREETGSILAFLPGAADIRRTEALLREDGVSAEIFPLFGALSPAEQDSAVQPSKARKIVLATDIAESSLTIEGVRIVIDAGLAREASYSAQTGAQTLETVRASLASVDQRRGRAGRTEPGVCYRLWSEPEQRGLSKAVTPEILKSDLSGLVLDLAGWGEQDPLRLNWLDAPNLGNIRAAKDLLVMLGALDVSGALTDIGKHLAVVPLPARLSAMIAASGSAEEKVLAACLAALLSERGLGGRSADITTRLQLFLKDQSKRAQSMRKLVERWGGRSAVGSEALIGKVLARGFPDRIARRRDGQSGRYVTVSGMGCRFPSEDPLARSEFLVIPEVTGKAGDLSVQMAAPISKADVLERIPLETVDRAEIDSKSLSVSARRVQSLGAIVLDEQPISAPKPSVVAPAMCELVRAKGLAVLPGSERVFGLIARVALIREQLGETWPDWTEAKIATGVGGWLAPILETTLPKHLSSKVLEDALMAHLGWPMAGDIDTLAPKSWHSPMGRDLPIYYSLGARPMVSCRVQEVFGLTTHPAIVRGQVRLKFSLLSPANREVALTEDIQRFWETGYPDLRKDMRGRYPKHPWPDDPRSAEPTLRAKPRS